MKDVRFVKISGFTAVGIARYYTLSETDQIGDLWDEFIPRRNDPSDRTGSHTLGICDLPADVPDEKEFRYIACVEVSAFSDDIPQGMVKTTIPPHDYAVFTHKGSIENIGETYDYIHSEWLPQSEFDSPQGEFEYYDDRFNCEDPTDEDSEFDIYVAVIKKGK